jgi:CRISPR-associated protein Cas1
MQLFVDKFGAFLGRKSERLVIREKGVVVEEVPLRQLEQITISSPGVSLSSDLIRDCMELGIQINFLTGSGQPYAKLTSPNITGTVATRREQILAYLDERGVALGKAFIEGKLRNQAAVLKYFAKYRKGADLTTYKELMTSAEALNDARDELDALDGKNIDEVRGQIFAIEGRAAQRYWQGVSTVLGRHVEFEGRAGRGATDPVNSCLNYGYGILYTQVWGAVTLAGLEPFAGFVHTDRPGKPSLILDLTEEFRAQVVDRVIVAMVTKGGEIGMEEDRLTEATRKDLVKRVLERLDGEETVEGKRLKLKAVIQRQARRIASYLRGEGRYRPWVGSW